jgi:hypothetical protein
MPIPIGSFRDVSDTFEPVPAGTYNARVSGGELKESGPDAKHPGSQYIAWEFDIVDPGFENRKAWLNASLHENAKPVLKRTLRAFGFAADELDADDFQLEIDDVIGKSVRLVIVNGINPNTKEPNHSVKRVLGPSEDSGGAVVEDELP